MFHSSDICVINKIDLLPYVKFDVEKAKEYAAKQKITQVSITFEK